jgi:hypothetical protein
MIKRQEEKKTQEQYKICTIKMFINNWSAQSSIQIKTYNVVQQVIGINFYHRNG